MTALDAIDRLVLNRLQEDMPLSSRLYADVAAELGLTEADLIDRIAG